MRVVLGSLQGGGGKYNFTQVERAKQVLSSSIVYETELNTVCSTSELSLPFQLETLDCVHCAQIFYYCEEQERS